MKLAVDREQLRRVYLNDYYEFLGFDGFEYWVDGKHLRFLARKLQEVEQGKIKRLMVFMPPRHGKSELISKKFPAWYLGKHPDHEIILATYGAELSYDFSRIARETLRRNRALFGVELDDKSQAVQRWGIKDHRGGMVAVGVGGPITGRGFHIGIIDDPVKNREEANSETIRNKTWEWYRSTFRTRAYPDAAIILVMTRWHEDDLGGRLLQEQEGDWEVIRLPAVAEDNDLLGRAPGDPLWPERYTLSELEGIRRDIGSHEWLALYQQRPTAPGGNLFKREWLQYVDSTPQDLRIYQTVDLAISKKETADNFVILTFGMDKDANVFIFDLYVGHNSFPEQVKLILSYFEKWKPLRVGIESTAYQQALAQHLRAHTAVPVQELKPSADKVTRALKITPHFENGKVYVHRNLPFREEFESERSSLFLRGSMTTLWTRWLTSRSFLMQDKNSQ